MGTDTHNTEVPWKTLGLYAGTLALELPVTLLRIVISWIVAAIVIAIIGAHQDMGVHWGLVLGMAPLVWSASALIPHTKTAALWIAGVWVLSIVMTATGVSLLCVLSVSVWAAGVAAQPWSTGWWWRTRVGGREPSTREREAYQEAVELLHTQAAHHDHVMQLLHGQPRGELSLPREWFVLDTPEPEAAVCGQTLMLSRPMLESPHLPAVLAHELGHLSTWDSRLCTAINRLVIHPFREPRPDEERYKQQTTLIAGSDPVTQTIVVMSLVIIIARGILHACRGGLGLWILRPLWGHISRENEHQADAFAASLGFGDELADFLETNALIYDQPVPFTWLSAESHPPAELRIDRLLAYANETSPTPAPPASPVDLARPATPIQEELPGLEGATT